MGRRGGGRSKGATHRPFQHLEVKPRATEPRFAEHAATRGVLPVNERPRVAPEREPPPLRLPAPPVFEVQLVSDRIRGWRRDAPFPEEALVRRPEATLDLHGARAEDAERRVKTFVRDARRRWRRVVLVITGRGRGPGGVLRAAVPDWLVHPTCGAHVLAFVTAPQLRGGPGAYLVLLAPREGKR